MLASSGHQVSQRPDLDAQEATMRQMMKAEGFWERSGAPYLSWIDHLRAAQRSLGNIHVQALIEDNQPALPVPRVVVVAAGAPEAPGATKCWWPSGRSRGPDGCHRCRPATGRLALRSCNLRSTRVLSVTMETGSLTMVGTWATPYPSALGAV